MDEAAVEEMVAAQLKAGVNFFDHSEAYGGQQRARPRLFLLHRRLVHLRSPCWPFKLRLEQTKLRLETVKL
jgi:hypothetical protein